MMKDLLRCVEAAQSGDEAALESLLEQLRPVFQRFFKKRIGIRPEIEDLVQNSLLRVHRGLPALKEPAKIRGFAMKAAVFELNDFYRGRYSMRELLIDTLPDHIESASETQLITALDIEKALAELSPGAREILRLREEGYRYKEIAERMGSTEAAVKMMVKRSFEKLRNMLPIIILFPLW